ncbi:MAG: NUDIX domain-containing protein [Chloroflexota bacterium]
MSTLGVEVVVIQDDKVLLTLRSDVPFYCLPGGGVENGETVAGAAVREVYEECGIHVQLTRLVGVYSRPNWANGGDHGVVFTAVPISGELQALDGEVVSMDYFAVDALPENLLWWQKQRILDGLLGETAVAYHQDVPWPFETLSSAEVRTKMKQNLFTPNDIDHFLNQLKSAQGDFRQV